MKDTDQKQIADSEFPGSVSEFPSVRSKTSRTITIREFVDTVRSDRYRRQVQEYRRLKALPGHEAEAQAVKDSMPCIVPAGICRGGHAVQCLLVHSALLCIDLDHTGDRTREVLELTRSLPFTCISFISISGEGIKVLVRIRKEDVQEDYARLYSVVGSAVSTHVRHPYDEKCKILTQPCFYSYDPEAYWNAEAVAFQMPECPSLPDVPLTIPPKVLATGQSKALQIVVPDTSSVACGFISRLLDEFERNNPFRRGNRNDLALKLGRVAGSKGFSPEELEKLIALFSGRYASGDFTAEDIRQRVLSGYQFVGKLREEKNTWVRDQKRVRVTYSPDWRANEEESPEVVLEKNDELRADAPYIPDDVFTRLPDLLARCCRYTSDKRERDMTLLGCLNSCSALFPYVRFYYKKSLHWIFHSPLPIYYSPSQPPFRYPTGQEIVKDIKQGVNNVVSSIKNQAVLTSGIVFLMFYDVKQASSPEYKHQRSRDRRNKEGLDKNQANVAKSIENNITATTPSGDPMPKRDPDDGGKKTKIGLGVGAIGLATEFGLELTNPDPSKNAVEAHTEKIRQQPVEKKLSLWETIKSWF